MKALLFSTFLLVFISSNLISSAQAQPVNLAKGATIEVSSFHNANQYPARYLNDTIVSDPSRWLSAAEAESWATITMVATKRIGGIHLYSGYKSGSPLQDFKVQFYANNRWNDIPSANVVGNYSVAAPVRFDENVEVRTNALRVIITRTPGEIARVREITVWEYSGSGIPPLGTGVSGYEPYVDSVPPIYINQSGYNLNKPKRFTAPTIGNGTPFTIKNKATNQTVFTGSIQDNIGEFSTFNPISQAEYTIVIDTLTSFPFKIGHWWLERVSYQGSVDFMIDSRHYVGNHTGKRRDSYSWRDDTHYGWVLHCLVPQFLSSPTAYLRMPSQVRYVVPSNRELWGDLNRYNESAPDIVKLMHWGGDVIVTQGLTHENIKVQLPYFLYAWPWIKEWLPQQNYDKVKAFTFSTWENTTADRPYSFDESPEHNLLALKTKMGTSKGGLPPGRNVQPNLMLYEVAKRDNMPNAEKYFSAAYNQVEWMVRNLDWEDSITTKGQRISEFHTITGMVHMLTQYPDKAPAGLKDKIKAWANVMVRRSNNMWDFRTLTDNGTWVPFDDTAPTKWNEPGNVVGFPACALAVTQVIDDATIVKRLNELVYSHMDNCFGRNPCGRHFSYDGAREIEGVDKGWYSFYIGGVGMLEESRFVFDGAAKNAHYPYNPDIGDIGWTEGWVQHNVPFNLSLAYMAYNDISLTCSIQGSDVIARLKAPLNFKYGTRERADVVVTQENGSEQKVTLTEESNNAEFFSGKIPVTGSKVTVSYGYGYFKKQVVFDPSPISFRSEIGINDLVIFQTNPALYLIAQNKTKVNIRLFDIRGKMVAPQLHVALVPGKNKISLNPFNLSNGQYIVSLEENKRYIYKKVAISQ